MLLHHPHAELVAVTSRQNAGQTLAQVFPKFASHPKSKTLRFTEPKAEVLAKQADVVFLALPHGVAAEYAVPLLDAGCVVIDLSADFRLKSAEIYKEFYAHDHPAPELLKKSVYGLPEIYRDEIKKSLLIASPGCYPTSILLPMIPLLKAGLVKPTGIIADSLSGVSGAGRKAEMDYLFCECNESVRPYGVPKHRHLSEIEEQLSLAAGDAGDHPVHAAFDSGESRHFDDALPCAGKTFFKRGGNEDAERKNFGVLRRKLTARNRSSACSKARRCPTRKMSSARTSSKSRGGSIRARAGSSS